LPDRAQVSMTVPFMRAYTELLVKTCHRRGAFAMGGMAAFIPSRRDPKVNEVALPRVRDDKLRESRDGFDGTWVAHPDLVPVAREVFEEFMGDRANQLDRQRPEVAVEPRHLLDLRIPDGQITEAGLRGNISIGMQYIESWLRGTGAAAIFNLMEDAATAEISRSQVWQWVHHGATLETGQRVTRELVLNLIQEELETIRQSLSGHAARGNRFDEARQLFEQVALSDRFTEFLTVPAYAHVD
jgi:malate synthase